MPTYNAITTRTETGEGSGSLVPNAERREILKGMVEASAVLSLARRVNMSTKHEKQPVLSALPAAYWVDGDTGLKETTKAEWGNKQLVAEELAVILPIPEALVADAAYDLFGEMRPLIIEALGAKLDDAVLFGDDAPASFEDALVPAAISAGNSVARGDVVLDGYNDLALDIGGEGGVMGQVEEDGFNVTGFAARTRLKAALRGLRDSTGAPIFQPSLTVGTPATLYGEPVFYGDRNGAWNDGIDLIAGDWSKLVVGVRQDITFKLFTEGVISDGSGNVVLNLMQQDSVALRVVARYAFTVANPINRMNSTEAERYPFAVLENPSS
jgi:HK97 family phage major capsid protein